MTLASKITVARILLIPVFVLFAIYYGHGVSEGQPREWQRGAAIAVFIAASVSDLLDGWVARRFGQTSRVGAMLDPIADKGLLLTAIITLSLSNWERSLPIWFPVVVIARDAVILTGCGLLNYFGHPPDIRPSLSGKIATALQMVAVAWVMLQLPYLLAPVWLAGVFTVISAIGYIVAGTRQLHLHDRPL